MAAGGDASERMEVVIAGAGVAGLVLAHCLLSPANRDLRLHVTVVEARSRQQLVDHSAGSVEMARNAMEHLTGISSPLLRGTPVPEVFRAVSQTYKAAQFLAKDGTRLKQIHVSGAGDESRVLHWSVQRSELVRQLLEALPASCDLVYGDRVASFTQDSAPGEPVSLTVSLASGRQLPANLLVGADGVRSSVGRAAGYPEPQYRGITAFWACSSECRAFPPESAFILQDRGTYFGGGVGKALDVTWAAFISDEAMDLPREEGGSFRPLPVEERKEFLHRQFKDWAPNLKEVVDSTPAENIAMVGIYDREPCDSWSPAPGVVLVGDAAHAMTPFLGQGANYACTLAGELIGRVREGSLSVSGHEAAVAAYEEKRIPATNWKILKARMVANTLLSDSWVVHTAFQIGIRFVPHELLRHIVSSYDRGNEVQPKGPEPVYELVLFATYTFVMAYIAFHVAIIRRIFGWKEKE